MSKKIQTRIQHKHDIEANWLLATNFIPLAGELIIYEADANYSYQRFKIGDGKTLVNALPFCTISADNIYFDSDTTVTNYASKTLEQALKEIQDYLANNTTVNNQLTADLANKADKTHTHSSYVNQNAFSNVKVGSTTVAADTTTDTLTLVAGNNVTITPDATNDTITIAATDTVYTHPTTSGNKHIPSGGSSGQILRWSADGTAVWGADNNTTYTAGQGLTLTGTDFDVDNPLYFIPKANFTTTAGSSTSGAYLSTKWSVANVDGITTPADGMTVLVRVPAVGVSTAGIVMSINGGSTYYPVVRNVNTVITSHYGVDSTIMLTFNATQTATAYLTSNTASTVTGCWQIADYDKDTSTNVAFGNGYATCSTAAATTAKTVSLSSYALSTGGRISVRFTNGNTASSPTLNINSKGAKSIYFQGAALTDTTLIKAGDIVTFVYSSQYHIVAINGSVVTSGSYGQSASASPAHSGTFTVPYVTVDKTGRVTGISNSTITLPSAYTKTEIDNMEFITVEDIDEIWGTTIEVATGEEVTF